jgi:hypothetical protein
MYPTELMPRVHACRLRRKISGGVRVMRLMVGALCGIASITLLFCSIWLLKEEGAAGGIVIVLIALGLLLSSVSLLRPRSGM